MLATVLDDARTTSAAADFAARLGEHKRRPRLLIHGFHRWHGKLIPAIPAAAIEAFTEAGDLVADPFCGSGTTLVEARAEDDEELRELFVALASAVNRDVSNADTRHVFPGVSKRMRALIAEGWQGDVPKRLRRALRDRLAASAQMHELACHAPAARVR